MSIEKNNMISNVIAMKYSSIIWVQWFLLLSLILCVSVTSLHLPSWRPISGSNLYPPPLSTTEDNIIEKFKTFYYTQTLDHFNYRPESYSTFQQRYVMSYKNWGGGNAPIFAHLGAEAPLENIISSGGLVIENAARFNALVVFIEHRYYGKSMPFGSRQEAMKNASTLGYFNSAQALADYAEILMHIKKKNHAKYAPVIVFGGSYGGMLASWFRLKYPHIALGALASSAPLLYFDNITPESGYAAVTTKDFRETSETCYRTIKKSWSEIIKIASKPNGLTVLSKKFKTCMPLKNVTELIQYLGLIYSNAAQYDTPTLPLVSRICSAIDQAPFGTDTLCRVYAGIVALNQIMSGNVSCYINGPKIKSETEVGWRWQVCSEMLMHLGSDNNNTLFPYDPYNLNEIKKECKEWYGITPRPHWITTYYGGQDIELILESFGSNIIFSNGLRDPFSSAGVLEDISDTIVAVKAANASHCMDLLFSTPKDPQWLINMRKAEMDIIEKWIHKYHVMISKRRKYRDVDTRRRLWQ